MIYRLPQDRFATRPRHAFFPINKNLYQKPVSKLDYDLMVDWVQPPRKCSADAVWIVQCGVSGDRDLVYKPLYGTWFYDAEKRTPENCDQPLQWIEITSKRITKALNTLGRFDKGKFVPIVGNSVQYKIEEQTYVACVRTGFKSWQLKPSRYSPAVYNAYRTSKFYTKDSRVAFYEVPFTILGNCVQYQTSIPVDKRFGVPMLETDKQRFLVIEDPGGLSIGEACTPDDADDQFSIPNMIKTLKRRREETVRIQKECDEQADQMMQNGVKINPMLRQMFPGSGGS